MAINVLKKRALIIAALSLFAAVLVYILSPAVDIINIKERGLASLGLGRSGPALVGALFMDDSEEISSQKIQEGDTFAKIASSTGMSYENMLSILVTAKNTYNLEKIVVGHEISFISDKEDGTELNKIIYQIDSEEALILTKNATSSWMGERLPIPYEIKQEEISGEITSSLFETITDAGGDERVALALAEMFAWQIDFAADIRTGDSFKAVYEKRFINGNYIAPGKILAAKFINEGRESRGIYFRGSDGRSTSSGQAKEGYYDENGLSLQKIFLKSPLSYKYISSGFSYNRLNPVSKSIWGPHRAIDYAADYGTPAVTVGEGTVTSAGWNGGLGIAVFVRHNDTYTTVYAHLSRLAVSYGAKVKQGQIIGYVGATGETTGPHLHFELRKFGARVNPLTIELPPGDPIAETDRAEFQKTVEKFGKFFNA